MQNKPKSCKGTGIAKGSGCGKLSNNRKYGLCSTCKIGWAMNTENGKEWLKKQTAYKMKSNEKEKKKEDRDKKRELNVSGSMKLADTYFSRYIRLKHSKDGYCTCYTCGTDVSIKELDNGHYQKREHKATRYHENNCRPQCKTCNGDVKHNGKQDEFRVNLVNEIGEEKVIEIERLAKSIFKVNTKFFRDTSDYYRIKLNELQKKLRVKFW